MLECGSTIISERSKIEAMTQNEDIRTWTGIYQFPNLKDILCDVVLIFLLVGFSAAFVCEDLPNDVCAFSVSSAGKRCLIETMAKNDGSVEYQCRTSEVMVEGLAEYMETDECVNACGVDRKSVGISSDALLEPQFMGKLCSPNCYQKCPNIVELYFNLAAGEGKLPNL